MAGGSSAAPGIPASVKHSASLAVFQGRCADRNSAGIAGAALLGAAISRRLGLAPTNIGEPEPALAADWAIELEAARPTLEILSQHLTQILSANRCPILISGRCAASIATLPVVARHRPDAIIVWFDAHGDCNTPESSPSEYLGGMVLTGASGVWTTGLGGELDLAHVILVGARDLDPFERGLIERGQLRLVEPGPNLSSRLTEAVGGRPVYIHLDCDVLDPEIVPTEYSVPGGLGLDDLFASFQALRCSELVGLEIAELQDRWFDGRPAETLGLMAALEPLLAAVVHDDA